MMRKLNLYFSIALAIFLFVVACRSESPSLTTESSLKDPWTFQHIVIDNNPLASYRINDIQIGDINGDGMLDLWTSGRGSGMNAYQMVWYKNPTWERNTIAKGDYKYGDLGDIDNDGDLDIIAGQNWFENTGYPTSDNWPKHSLGYSLEPDLVLVNDLNDDKRTDIIFATKKELWWLPGPENPRGQWKKYKLYEERSSKRTGGTLADLDQDGDTDIIYGNAWFEHPPQPTKVPWDKHIIDNNWPAEARSAIADLDRDGKLDIVLSDEEGNRGLAWFRAPTDPATGQWEKKIITTDYSGLHSLQIADFNQDKKLDVFAAEMHTKGKHRVAIFESVDINANSWVEHLVAMSGSHNAKVEDIDSDGYPDIVGKNFGGSQTEPLQVDLWLNKIAESPNSKSTTSNKWQRHIIDKAAQSKAVFVDSGDLNLDGQQDIITGKYWYQNPGDLDSKWKRHKLGPGLNNMAAVYDFDQDGDLDVLGNRGKTFIWLENDGSGSLAPHHNIAPIKSGGKGDFLQGARVGQILSRDNPEVVISWHNGDTPPGEGTQLFRVPSPATEQWTWEKISNITNSEQIAIGDLDGDGDIDIHLGSHWLRQEKDSQWTDFKAINFSNIKANPDRVELVDIDNDKDLDVVVACEHDNRLSWGENPSDPTDPWLEHVITTDYLLMSMDVGDLDKDGNIDVVAGEHKGSGRAFVFQNMGNGSSWQQHIVDAGDYSKLDHHDGTQLVDIDQDGDLDIISIGWNSRILVMYENKLGEAHQ